MVGHAARRAQGRAQQEPPLTPRQVRLLLSDQGRAAVAAASALDLAPAARIATATSLRRLAGPELGPLAVEQALLKQRARAKHARGDELWWTAEALEQATSEPVARHRARRFDRPVLDLCCSVGGDLLALPEGSTGVDLDEARLLLAAANARVLDRRVSLVRADVTTLDPTGDVFCDPARRAGGRRVFDPDAYVPPLSSVLGWRPRALGVKVAPGIDWAVVPAHLEAEVVSLGGDVKEAVLWGGAARTGSARTATLLPAGDELHDVPVPVPQVRPPGRYLLEPDGAVVRAGLVAQVAAQVGGGLLDATIAYVTADELVPTPFGRWYAVREVLPFGVKRLREALRAYDAGPLVVKKRGTAVTPEELRRALRLRGSREVVVVLTRASGRQIALIVDEAS